MKILVLGTDSSALRADSSLQRRIIKYGELVEKYFLIVPDLEKVENHLNGKTKVFGSGGRKKPCQLWNIFFIAKKMAKEFDLISVQDQYYLGLVAWLVKTLSKKRLEIQIHGFEKYSGLRKMVAKFIVPRADAVRVVSERLKQRMIDEFGVDAKKVTVVPIYVDRVTHNAQRIAKNDRFIFLTVGRLVEVKNIILQINAMADVVKKFPNTELWIVGRGPLKEALGKRAKELGIENNIKFIGWQSNVAEFYRQADAFMLTSFAEGWPLVIIEAASYGLPIIMTDMGSAGEFIIDGVNGLVVPQNNKDRLAEAMLKLIPDSDFKKEIIKNLEISVAALPSEEEILKLYLKSWQAAIK
jgi:glycosyltransferase involved in cell wall biosynthesis